MKTQLIFGGIAVVLLGALIFHAGVSYGARRTLSRFGHPPPPPGFPHSFIPQGHGAVGTIASITPPTMFLLSARDGDQETVLISSTTLIRSGSAAVPVDALTRGATVSVIGDPSQKPQTISARIIHVLP